AAAAQVETDSVKPAVHPAASSVTGSAGESQANPEAPRAKTSAEIPASSAPAEQIRNKEDAAPRAGEPPPLDLKSLEQKLRDTDAIGVFTKLTLKNQVDDLLGRFKAYYQGLIKTTLAELRQPYDLLMLKVLSLLQDRDPPLAKAILESREEIWGILSDPAKFSNL
ncbi:MAG: hypothetical protein ACREA9_28935, partial [Pyrinomonadaceae bacterium]